MWKTISRSSWAKYCCGDQTGWQNRIGWIREILVTKKNYEEEFELLQFK
jgi:hypothetical protein